MKSLKEKCSSLEDKKSATFFKIYDAIVELGGPHLVWYSMFISSYEFEFKVSKLKDKWDWEFDSLKNFSEDNIKAWIIYYVNLK